MAQFSGTSVFLWIFSSVFIAKFLKTLLVAKCHLSKYFDKLYGNVVYQMQIQMSNFIQVLVIAAISEFWFLGFSTHTIYKLITAAKEFLIAFLVEINNKKPDQIISKLSTLSKYFTCSLILFCTCGTLLNIPGGYLHYNW